MLNREDKKFLRGVFSKYDYIMTTSQLKEEKLFYRDIQKLLNDGYIEKIKRGYYAWVEATTKTEVRIIKGMFPDAVLCMETALFYYRFSDYYKRKDIIDQFPVFAGMISQEYYSDLIQLNTLKAQLKQKYKKQKANEKSTAYIKENLSPLLTDYFALLEKDFDDKISAQKMLKMASNLPEFDDTQLFGESKIAERYSVLNEKLEELRNEEREILLKIKNIDNASKTGNEFTEMLMDLKQVYFPQGDSKDDEITQADLMAVNKMYKTIFDEINSIGEDTGILPQIIIVDHVDGNNLECEKEFEEYVRCNWRNGQALI